MTDERNGEVPAREDRVRDHSLDELAKGLASGSLSRRDALKWAGAALVGGLLSAIPGVAWADHKSGHGTPPGQGGTNPGKGGGTPPGQGTTTSTTTTRPPVDCSHTCAHDPCQEGLELTPSCDTAGCVATVCEADTFCCPGGLEGSWDEFCIALYTQCAPNCCPAGTATVSSPARRS
jgi:hypothetical protein